MNARVPRRSVLIAVTAVLVAASAFGVYRGTIARDHDTAGGSFEVVLAGSGSGNRFSVSATRLVPGDTIERAITITPTGPVSITALRLTTDATSSSVLDTDGTNGLQITIRRCSVAWDETLSDGIPVDYDCSGSESTPIAARPAIMTNQTLTGALTSDGQVNYLLLHMELPSTADNTFLTATSTIRFTFSGVQRSGEYK
jgi:spore coat-associated protein N